MVRAGRLFAWLAAVLLFVSAVWYGLLSEEITVDDRADSASTVEGYYEWFSTTVTQERLVGALAVLGIACLIVVGWAVRERIAPDGGWAGVGALAITAGALLWIVGNIVDFGGAQAVKDLTERGGSIEPVMAIDFAVNEIDDAFELFGFAFLGVGVLAMAWEALRATERRPWTWLTVLTGLVFLVLSGAYAAQSWDLVDALLVFGGAVLLPAWLVSSAQGPLRGEP
jgi:peptidoglycan/LPS O-acetylase OafA/YrhL